MGRVVTMILALGVLLLMACPPPQDLGLYNNTGSDVTVVVREKRIEWKAGTVLHVSDDAEIRWDDLAWEVDPERQASVPVLAIETSAGPRRYRLAIPSLPAEFIDTGSGMKRRLLQLERDGGLYALTASARAPIDPPPSQPPGMPIEPVRE